MRIVGYHIQGNEVANSLGELATDNYIDFLVQDIPDSIKVFYNLDWSVARLIYLLGIPEERIRDFWKTGKLYYQGIKIYFIPHRYLSIEYGHHWGSAVFSDIFQYDVSLPFQIDTLEAAKRASEIGQQVYDALIEIGLHPSTLSSPVACYQKEILLTHDLPTWEDNEDEVNHYAFKCLTGGWQENYQKGHFPEIFDYDITSAYSFHMMNLPDPRFGKWEKSDKFFRTPLGFCKGTVRIDSDFSPIAFQSKDIQYTPKGEFQRFLTVQQIVQLYDNKIGQFKLDSGWYWHPEKLVYPFKRHIETLFDWKCKSTGMQREIIKRMLVGIWGKTSETFGEGENVELGKMFNPVFAAPIETGARIQLADFIIKNNAQNDVISLTVDGTTLTKKIELLDTEDIGSWRQNISAPCYAISSGVQCIKGKHSKGNFSLKYDWLEDQISKNPDATEYPMSKVTPITIGYALKFNLLDKLGELETKERAVILDLKEKRYYPERPKTGKELQEKIYKSSALYVSEIMVEELIGSIDENTEDNEVEFSSVFGEGTVSQNAS